MRDPQAPEAERWRAFEPFWKHASLTGYAQALRLSVRDLYGCEEITAASIPSLNAAIRKQNRPGLYREVLKNRARIRIGVEDAYWDAAPVKPDPEFFLLAHRFDRFITVETPQKLAQLEKLTNLSITTLAGLKRAMESSFEAAVKLGMVAVKSVLAYEREIHFNEVDETAAQRDFQSLQRGERPVPQGFHRSLERPYRNLEDHMFHHLLRVTEAHRLPVQVHTGLLAGTGGMFPNTRPTHLLNVFALYPGIRFDVFHIGYPYYEDMGVAAKVFPNVYIDFCWAHIVSPPAARLALRGYLETVPANKIFGFGGDYRYPELTYGHLRVAQRNVAAVLAELVEDRLCGEDQALELGRRLMHDNAADFFGYHG